MLAVRSCGVLVFRREPTLSFLLMKHADRYDLPKGHVENDETDLECAIREMEEESGLTLDVVRLVSDFEFATTYYPRSKRHGSIIVRKTVTIYLGWLEDPHIPIVLTEHGDYEWVDWPTSRIFGNGTIDGVLSALQARFEEEENAA